MQDLAWAESEEAGLELGHPPLSSSRASVPHLATSGTKLSAAVPGETLVSNSFMHVPQYGTPLQSFHPRPVSRESQKRLDGSPLGPSSKLLTPPPTPLNLATCPSQAPYTCPDAQHYLFVPLLLVLHPPSILVALAFLALP